MKKSTVVTLVIDLEPLDNPSDTHAARAKMLVAWKNVFNAFHSAKGASNPIEWREPLPFKTAGDALYIAALERHIAEVIDPALLRVLPTVLGGLTGETACDYEMGGTGADVCVPCSPPPCHMAEGVIMEKCPGSRAMRVEWHPTVEVDGHGIPLSFYVTTRYTLEYRESA